MNSEKLLKQTMNHATITEITFAMRKRS